jgi:hypothetical protein
MVDGVGEIFCLGLVLVGLEIVEFDLVFGV